ncbi:unnamed protein product [Allacma fusca]|uniref:Peptidase S1 domain-containing protein n=1 Tax=Allacma fusca TaxID=39272 RepID=A0A8J2K5S9_9HEXA|nr:unnamed protein product [Allacma fusca]
MRAKFSMEGIIPIVISVSLLCHAIVVAGSLSKRPYLNFADVDCGVRQLSSELTRQGKASNSHPSLQGEFPWMASFRFNNNGNHFCGGFIISRWHILSAAHCFLDSNFVRPVKWMDVVIGGRRSADDEIKFEIDDIIIHPSYKRRGFHNDIAVVKLHEAIEWSPLTQPLCLPDPELEDVLDDSESQSKVTFQVAGWGSNGTSDSSEELRKAEIEHVYKNEECQKLYAGNDVQILDSHLCAGGGSGLDYEEENLPSDACVGDSGGPLMATKGFRDDHQNTTIAIGIVAAGKGCAKYPGIYSRISKLVGWIREVVNDDGNYKRPEDNSVVIDSYY